MNKSNQITNDETINTKRAFWAAVIFTFVALTSFIFAIILAGSKPIWQVYAITAITVIALSTDAVGLVLVWRGRTTLGLKYFYWSLLFTVPPNVLLVTSNTPFLIAIVLVVGCVHVYYLQPHGLRKSYQFGPIVASVLMAAAEVFQPAFRVNLTQATSASGYFGGTTLTFLVISLIVLIVRQSWSSSIRVKLVTAFTVVVLTAISIVGTISYFSYRNQIRADIRQRLLNIISITALQQNGDLFETIQTTEDQNSEAYQKMQAVNASILATDRNLAYIFSVRLDEQGKMTFVVDSGLEEGYDPVDVGTVYNDPSELLAQNAHTLDHPIVEQDFYSDIYGTFLSAYAPLYRSDGTRVGIVGVDIFADKVLAQERTALFTILGVTIVTLILVAAIGLFLANLFTKPITNLSSVALKFAEGDLSISAKIESNDEIGALAAIFNTMTSRLRETLQGLEQRIADRTRNLELAAEVGRSVSQVRALDVMLKDAAELIRSRFDMYYVQVYLTDPSQTNLILQAGTGIVGKELLGRNHRLPFNSASINGRAAIEKKSVVISNTADSPTFKPNPLLPNTRSEMAVPLMIGDRVVGVLDMQSEVGGSLSTDILAAFEALAGQIAIAIQNANFLAETQQARTEVEAQAQRLTRTNWKNYLDAIHKPEETGYMFEQNKITPLKQEAGIKDNAMVTPITVTGEALGNLVVQMEGQSPIARTDELLTTVARQISQQIENLRLLDSAERYRFEAEEASRRLTRKGWQSYVSNADESMSYVYDLKEVRAQNDNGDRHAADNGYTLPLKVRDETVGRLVVQGMDADDGQSVSLATAVAERLGAHIESLRQFEETQRGQIELDKRARQLAAVANVSSVSSRELDIEKMLQSVVNLTQRQFGLYHAHVFTYNENTETLQISACGWKEGDEHEGTHGTAVISLSQEQSLVARSARNKEVVIVNNVHNEPGWLPNPLLPDTNSEIAVPLIIGDKILGVLDVQADYLNAFSTEDANIYTTLASQVSTALQNAQFFVRAQQQAERESTLNIISQKIQGATTVEAVLQIAARELGHALGAPMTIAQLSMKDKN